MFNDERINLTCGKIFRKSIIFSTIIAVCFIVTKALSLSTAREAILLSMINETVIILAGLAIIIYAEIKSVTNGKTDERVLYGKYNFYVKSAKWYLLVVVLAYAIEVPIYLTHKCSFAPNLFLLITESIGLAFLSYEFRKNNVNFNYTFIDDDKKSYYKKVLINILKLVIGVTVVYFVSTIFGIVVCLKNLGTFFLVMFLAYLLSLITLSVFYLLISWIEKVHYDEEDQDSKASTSVIICFLCTAVFLFVGTGAGIALNNIHILRDLESFDDLVLTLSYINVYADYFYWAFLGLTLSTCLSYFNGKNLLSYCAKGAIIFCIASILYHLANSLILHIIVVVSDNAFDATSSYNQIVVYISIAKTIVWNIIVLLTTIGLFKNLKMHWSVILYGTFRFVLMFINIAIQLSSKAWYVYFACAVNILDFTALMLIMIFVKGYAKNLEQKSNSKAGFTKC